MSLILQGSTSGSITLQEPAVAGTTVLTLPAVSGTFLTTTSPKAGNVIQVIDGTLTSDFSTSSTSFVTAGLSATITPTSSSNKIYAFVTGGYTNNNSGVQGYYTIYRGATNLGGTNGLMLAYSSGSQLQTPIAFGLIDSPATTSSTTYTVYVKAAGGTTNFNGSNTKISIILMEIAA